VLLEIQKGHFCQHSENGNNWMKALTYCWWCYFVLYLNDIFLLRRCWLLFSFCQTCIMCLSNVNCCCNVLIYLSMFQWGGDYDCMLLLATRLRLLLLCVVVKMWLILFIVMFVFMGELVYRIRSFFIWIIKFIRQTVCIHAELSFYLYDICIILFWIFLWIKVICIKRTYLLNVFSSCGWIRWTICQLLCIMGCYYNMKIRCQYRICDCSYYRPSSGMDAKYCSQHVCLSPVISHKSQSKFHQIFCTCYMWPWLSPSLTTVQCVLWMTSYFHILERIRIKDDAYVSSSSPSGGTGGEVCHLSVVYFLVPVYDFLC